MLRVIIQMWKSCMSSFNCLYCYTWQRFYHQYLHLSLEKQPNTLEIGIGVVLCTVIARRALKVTWALALWPSLCLVLVLSCTGPCGKDSVCRVSLLVKSLRGGPWCETTDSVPLKGTAGCSGSSFMSLASLVHLVLKTYCDAAGQAWTDTP